MRELQYSNDFGNALLNTMKSCFWIHLSRCMLITLSVGVLCMLIAVRPAYAVLVCPTCQHKTIASALNDPAVAGQTVQVDPAGSPYFESNLRVSNRTLVSLTPGNPGAVVINGGGAFRPVLRVSGPAVVEGITITGANFTGPGIGESGHGGGISTGGGQITLRNLLIEGNSATTGGGVGGITGGAQLTIENCTIRNNTATGGAGGVYGGTAATTITGSTITGNTASSVNAGGVFLGSFSTNVIKDTIISQNSAHRDGGGLYHRGSRLTMSNVVLQGNTATGTLTSSGGGMYMSSTTGSPGHVDMIGGSVSGNSAVRGGGIVAGTSSGTTNINASVSGNVATDPIGSGGGIRCSFSKNVSIAGQVSGNSPDEVVGCGTTAAPLAGVPIKSVPADSEQAGDTNDPVNTSTGELFNQYEPDINLGGSMPLYFARYYSSGFKQTGLFTNMGTNWRHNFDWKMTVIGTTVFIRNYRGRSIQFAKNGLVWDLAGKTDVAYQLSVKANAYTLLDPRSQRSYVFDASGLLTKVFDAKGNVHSLSYANGSLTQVFDGRGRVLNFGYDVNNNLTSVDDSRGRVVSFVYTGSDMTSVVDMTGNTTVYNYSTASALKGGGLLSTMVRPAGNIPYEHRYWFSDKRSSSEFDSNGNKTVFNYINATTTTITGPLGNVRTHTHTATGELANRQDQSGLSFSMGSDTTGRRNAITDRLGGITSYVYDAVSGKMVALTNAEGNTTSFTYTPRSISGNITYDLTGITHADLTSETFVYDASGNMTSHLDQAGSSSTLTYNPYGQPLTLTNKLGGVITNSYNADATLASVTDPAFNTTAFAYDIYSRPSLVTYADGNTGSVTYDAADRVLTTTNENGNTVAVTYDLNGNLAALTDPLLNSTTFTYDGNDRLLSITEPLGGVSSRTYDQLGRVATMTDPYGNVTTNGYDVLNRLTSVTDPGGNVWAKSYNAEAIVSSITDPLLNTMTFISDAMGRITQVTSPMGYGSGVTYDVMGRVTTSTDALNNTTTFTRDVRGLLSNITLPGGTISTAYVRNAMGQKTSVTDPNANAWLRTYDSSGRLTTYTDPLFRAQAITYDNRNRVSTITYPGGLGSVTMSYDATGNLTGHAFTDGTTTSYTYDANNSLVAATGITRAYDANGRIVSSNGITLTRDINGRIASMTLAPGKAVTYAYDANSRLTSVTDWAAGVTSFTYDAAGRLTNITRPNAINGVYSYDNDSRLSTINEGVYNISLIRDANAHITSATRNLPQTASATGMTGRTNAFDAASQFAGASYDAVGRMTAHGADSFTWNLASQLTGYSVGVATATNTYDAKSRRLTRTVGATTRSYVWNDALSLSSISIEKQAAADSRYYIHTPDGQLLYSMDAVTSARNFYHYDEMGNTSFVTNDAGVVIGSYTYSPFGQVISSTGVLDNPFTWQGQYGIMDEGNGLYYVRARYYDSRSGRFINRDPVKSTTPKRLNPYQYALNNPMRFADATGRDEYDAANARLREAFGKKLDKPIVLRGDGAAVKKYTNDDSKLGQPIIVKGAFGVTRTEGGLTTLDQFLLRSKFLEEDLEARQPTDFSLAEGWAAAVLMHTQNQMNEESGDSLGGSIEPSRMEANKLHAPWADLPVYDPGKEIKDLLFPEYDPLVPESDEPESVVPELTPITVLC